MVLDVRLGMSIVIVGDDLDVLRTLALAGHGQQGVGGLRFLRALYLVVCTVGNYSAPETRTSKHNAS